MATKGNNSERSLLSLAERNPDKVLDALDRLESEESLRTFIELAWSILEPKREFQGGWHIDAICDALEAVTAGHIKRLLINVPPGCMKSLTTDVFWPAWEWGPKDLPSTRYVSSSYSQDLTIRDNRRTRTLITSPWYQRLWGDKFSLLSDQNAKTRFDNDKTGFKIATSVGGLATGERGDRFIIDDPHNIKDGESDAKRNEAVLWLMEVVPTRVNDPTESAIVTIMQRVHEGDCAGELLKRELGYTHLCLPMEFEPERKCVIYMDGFEFEDPRSEENELLWPNRMTRAVVERDKLALGEYAVAGQFQQRPAPRGGGAFKRMWWKFFETGQEGRPMDTDDGEAIPMPSLDWIVISVDAAFKKTDTGSRVGMLAVGGRGALRFVLDNWTNPMTFGETRKNIKRLIKKHPTCSRILIEDKANGPAIVDSLIEEIPGIIAVNPEGGKEARAAAIQPSVEAGQVFLPDGAPWLETFITEFAMFPAGVHDDQVDALSQAMIFMTSGVDVARAMMLGQM